MNKTSFNGVNKTSFYVVNKTSFVGVNKTSYYGVNETGFNGVTRGSDECHKLPTRNDIHPDQAQMTSVSEIDGVYQL